MRKFKIFFLYIQPYNKKLENKDRISDRAQFNWIFYFLLIEVFFVCFSLLAIDIRPISRIFQGDKSNDLAAMSKSHLDRHNSTNISTLIVLDFPEGFIWRPIPAYGYGYPIYMYHTFMYEKCMDGQYFTCTVCQSYFVWFFSSKIVNLALIL